MQTNRPHLYVNSKGYFVTRHSYSGSESFHFCNRKYFLERVQGWSDKFTRSSTIFGQCLEKAITFFHWHKLDAGAAAQEFTRLWAEHKDKDYTYTKTDLDWDRLNLTGAELVKLYSVRYPEFPYVVDNLEAFQVEINLEPFPGSKLAGIEFTSYIDLIAKLKGTGAPLIIDMKTSGKDVPEYTMLDPQLRSYAWVKSYPLESDSKGNLLPLRYPNVAFLWFRKCGRTISSGDNVTLLEPFSGTASGTDLITLSKDFLGGWWVTPNERLVEELDTKFVGKKKEVLAAREEFIQSNAFCVPENLLTKQKVQYKQAIITPDSAFDMGEAIKRDIVAIHQAKETDFYPMQSGVRFPNEKCPNCSMRGICSGNIALRDQLLVRKQMDEFEFEKVGE